MVTVFTACNEDKIKINNNKYNKQEIKKVKHQEDKNRKIGNINVDNSHADRTAAAAGMKEFLSHFVTLNLRPAVAKSLK